MKSWFKVLMCVAVSGMSIFFAGCNNPKEEEQGGSESQFLYQNTKGAAPSGRRNLRKLV